MRALIQKPSPAQLARVALISAMMFLASTAALAQLRPSPLPQATPGERHDGDVDFSTRESDIRTRLILKAEKKAYEEHVARAKEVRQVAADLKAAYQVRNGFSSDDRKQLERLEKLTRRIRNDAGGSDTNGDPKDLPTTMSLGVDSIADMADELCKAVEKTPRHVLSAAIIDQANKLISVIQYVRDLAR